MCTLSYIPLADQSYILTSNRDEWSARATSEPNVERHDNVELLYPKDEQAGGTWIAAADNGSVCCLLNGAFEAHAHQPPYRKSRGLVLLETIKHPNMHGFLGHVDLHNIEPFTLVMIQKNEHLHVSEFRWDGNHKYFTDLSATEAHLWCSAKLYQKEVGDRKLAAFQQFISNPANLNLRTILRFHKDEFDDSIPKTMLLDTPQKVCTVSVTQMVDLGTELGMHYEDLLSGSCSNQVIRIKASPVSLA